ncbi:unnamed protein product, partial [Ectocarpus fasciculatus]
GGKLGKLWKTLFSRTGERGRRHLSRADRSLPGRATNRQAGPAIGLSLPRRQRRLFGRLPQREL